MSRLIRFHRIGGRAAETPRGAPGRAIAMALAASFAVLAMGGESFFAPIDVAFAQTPGTSGPISLGDLFVTDTDQLKPGAADKLTDALPPLIQRGCPQQAKFTVRVKQGDPLFQAALAAARRDALKAFLQNLRPGSNTFEVKDELGSKDDVQVDYDRMQDREKPKLHTTSVPPKGTKVKPGDQITVTMVARDDATRWQTGIQRIQLIAQSPGDELVGAQDYPPVIRPDCEGRPEPRTLVLTYTVPRNPPPIVRLRAIAEDFANHHDTDIGEFPTGDWYGWVEWSETMSGPGLTQRWWGRLDFTADYDGRGNLTGKLVGIEDYEQSQIWSNGYRCNAKTTKPAKLEIPLLGSYTPGRNTILLSRAPDMRDLKFAMGELSFNCPRSPSIPLGRMDAAVRTELNEILRDLRLTDGGSAVATREWNPASNGIGKLRMTVTLHRAQN